MVSSSSDLQDLVTDTWIKATWEEFIALANDPGYINSKFYYHQGYMRIEMSPVGFRHGRHNSIISFVVVLFAAFKNIRIIEATNTSFRKVDLDEFQPDLSYYIGSELRVPPETDSPVDLNEYDPPTLVVEIAVSSVNDDLGYKRLLYERAGVREYWVVNAKARKVIAFSIIDGRSGEIQ